MTSLVCNRVYLILLLLSFQNLGKAQKYGISLGANTMKPLGSYNKFYGFQFNETDLRGIFYNKKGNSFAYIFTIGIIYNKNDSLDIEYYSPLAIEYRKKLVSKWLFWEGIIGGSVFKKDANKFGGIWFASGPVVMIKCGKHYSINLYSRYSLIISKMKPFNYINSGIAVEVH